MLAGLRFFLLVSFLFAFSVAVGLPVQAQINGVPPSVTSFGFGGSTNPTPGVRASVTSLGPNGYSGRPVFGNFGNCCNNLFMPANPYPPLFSGRHHRRDHDRDRNYFPVGVSEPVFIPYPVPYAVPYAEEADAADTDDDPVDADYVRAPVQRNQRPVAKRALDREPVSKAGAYGKQAVADPEEPPAVQPATALIFKDGHKSDVLNYAIVGDTLFDFDGGRTRKILLADLDLAGTRKANDERGVDFQIPASVKGQ
jgi:hypothetical protein